MEIEGANLQETNQAEREARLSVRRKKELT